MAKSNNPQDMVSQVGSKNSNNRYEILDTSSDVQSNRDGHPLSTSASTVSIDMRKSEAAEAAGNGEECLIAKVKMIDNKMVEVPIPKGSHLTAKDLREKVGIYPFLTRLLGHRVVGCR